MIHLSSLLLPPREQELIRGFFGRRVGAWAWEVHAAVIYSRSSNLSFFYFISRIVGEKLVQYFIRLKPCLSFLWKFAVFILVYIDY